MVFVTLFQQLATQICVSILNSSSHNYFIPVSCQHKTLGQNEILMNKGR